MESRWIETTREDKSTYPCQTMSQKRSKKFNHKLQKSQHQPYPSAPIIYGSKKQYATPKSTAPFLDNKGKNFIQQVCRKKLFLGKSVYSTLLCPISAIASQSENPTEDTMKQTQHLLDYIETQEDKLLTFNASDMKLAAHNDASYLSKPKARIRAGGHFFLSRDSTIPQKNGAVLKIAHIIKHVMSSATEAELEALYIMAREVVYISIILEEMVHKQPPTPLQTDKYMDKADKGNGYAFPLVEISRIPRTVQNILETRKSQLCRLLDKTPSEKTPSKHSKIISHATHCIRNVENRAAKFNNKSDPNK